MARYFTLISYHVNGERLEYYENVQRPNGLISIGWGQVNPIGSTEARIRRDLEHSYFDKQALNITNGVHSLALFSALRAGDVVFVRGDSMIVDVVIVTGTPHYQYVDGHQDDYFTTVSCVPLFGDQRFQVPVNALPEPGRTEYVFNEGRSRTMKEINQTLARLLLKAIIEIE